MTLTCKACQKTTKANIPTRFSYSVGDIMYQTSWHPLMGGDGGMNWICPNCGKKIAPLARQIKQIICPNDDFYIHFDSLLTIDEKPEKKK